MVEAASKWPGAFEDVEDAHPRRVSIFDIFEEGSPRAGKRLRDGVSAFGHPGDSKMPKMPTPRGGHLGHLGHLRGDYSAVVSALVMR